MTKGVKKKNRKLRRQIRKTIGALLMVSAITVAAIPVQDVSANPTDVKEKIIKVAVTSDEGQIRASSVTGGTYPSPTYGYASTIPYAQKRSDAEKIVYTSGDGMFQFAYTYINTTDRGAVILNFDNVKSTDTIKIPAEMEAYRKYAINFTGRNFCLVSLQDELLGYKLYQQLTNEAGAPLYKTVNLIKDLTGQSGAVGVENAEGLTTANLFLDEKDGKYYYVYNQKQWIDPTDHSKGTQEVPTYFDVEPMMGDVYYPCYYEQRDKWANFDHSELYYLPKKKDTSGKVIGDDYDAGWQPVGNGTEHWRIVAAVSYIGAEKIKETAAGWEVSGYRVSPDEGVFAGRKDITNLIFEGSIRGISDYAFYKCGTLTSVEFNSGLDTIGNGAFAECIQLQNVSIPRNAKIDAIGKDAFYNCKSLREFIIPDGLEALGDCAFEGCISLTNVNLLGSGLPVALQHLGNHLFKGCEVLSKLEFPNGYSETLDIDMFDGCKGLQYVKLPDTPSGEQIDFEAGHVEDATNYPACTDNTWDKFKETVPESFYFEGPDVSQIHNTAGDQSITYKYPDQELYEKVVYEHDVADGNTENKSAKTIYQLDKSGQLVKFGTLKRQPLAGEGSDLVDSRPDVITIPEKIGTFSIKTIGAGSFDNNCDLKRVTIPASVTEIGDRAFQGCHQLEAVVFTDASKVEKIGADAFRTQVTVCGDSIYPATGTTEPRLYLVGAMINSNGADTVPFQYAMNGASKINNNNTKDFWITCHSGWPTNLEVQYNYDTETRQGEAQLVGYPRRDQLSKTGWVGTLPYATTQADKDYYQGMANNILKYLTDKSVTLTPNEQEFLANMRNLVIPASVDSIKPGLFSGYAPNETGEPEQVEEDSVLLTPDKDLETILLNGVRKIEPYTFKDCTGLTNVAVIGSSEIDDYAFEDCTGLKSAVLGVYLTDTGKRPFKGCDNIEGIECLEGASFSYNNGIIYRNTGSGFEIVECLENRGALNGTGSYNVGPDELSGVTSIKPEAFAQCKEVSQVDLSKTTVDTIPDGCFKETALTSVTLPNTIKRIEKDSFQSGEYRKLIVYFKGDPMTIERDAFKNENPSQGQQDVIFQCLEKSNADYYAKDYSYINASQDEVKQEFTVEFWNLPDYPAMTNMERVDKQTVQAGSDAVPPKDNPVCKDPEMQFTGWSEYTNITKDTTVYAIYGSPEFKVTFIDGYTGDTLKEETVKYGGSATPPTEEEIPHHEGMMFSGWNKEYYNIKTNTIITAVFKDSSGDLNRHKVTFYDDDGKELFYQYVNDGDAPLTAQPPEKAGYTFLKWVWTPPESATSVKQDTSVIAQYEKGGSLGGSPGPSGLPGGSGSPGPSGSASPSSSASASPSASPEVKKYTVSVSGGSGSGSYAAGEIVALNAYYMGEGQNFDKWTTSTAGVGFANPSATSTTFTMPAANVAITATYKTGSGTSAAGAGGGGNAGTGGSGSGTNNGTTVEVTKPGISNTNLAGATVSGATDNFVIKVSEDQSATDAVVAALQARYGDLSRIKYLPMDISLYDSTGRVKIADTTGITVNLTLPLPDDLVQYAGNNKVAAVSNGALEDLNARFTTVGGVPCVNFTATHFSPYVIYVDTANLTEATIDTTPKTGDPIHPKWFLALGLACVSLILFFKRDKNVVIKTKTA